MSKFCIFSVFLFVVSIEENSSWRKTVLAELGGCLWEDSNWFSSWKKLQSYHNLAFSLVQNNSSWAIAVETCCADWCGCLKASTGTRNLHLWIHIYTCSLNTNSVFLAVLGKGENFTNCKRLSRQVCVLLKSPIPGTALPPAQSPELVRRMQWQCYVSALLYSCAAYYFENLLADLQKQTPKSLTPEILHKNTSVKKRVGFDLQSEIFD